MSVDPAQLRSSSRTTYHQSFFLLRAPLIINGQPAQITSDKGHLTVGSRYPPVSITFNSLTTEVDTIVHKYGAEGVSNYWCENNVPLFELKLSSQSNLRRLLSSEGKMQNELASRVAAMLAQQQKSPGFGVVVYAHTEVYMLTPLPETKDALVIRVSSEKDLETCATIWKESEVFNFEVLFRAFRMDRNAIPNQGEVTVKLLDEELKEVSDWYGLGLHLDIPTAELDSIRYEPRLCRIQDRKREMFLVWMRELFEPSWPCVVKALKEIGQERLAHKIALKYGTSVEKTLPKQDTSSQTSTPLQKKLSTQVEKLTKGVEEKDRELAVKSQSLEEAKRQKAEVNQRLVQTKQTIRQTQTKIMKLIQEKMDIEKKLQLREQELQFLCTGHHKDSEQLQNIIRNKEEEIRELQRQLHTVESKLTSERNLSKELRQKLQQAGEELAKKSAVEQEREEAKEYLKAHLERERQTVDSLRVQLTSNNRHTREVEHQLSTARAECESINKEIDQHRFIVRQKEEMVKKISQELKKQESLIAKLERELAATREGGAKREQELLQRIFEMTDEAAGMKDKLEEANEEKWGAVRKVEIAQVENKLLQSWMKELREEWTAFKVPPTLEPGMVQRAPPPVKPKPRRVKTVEEPPAEPRPETNAVAQKTPPPVKPKSKKKKTVELPLQLRWRRFKDMEYAMSGPHCVVLERSMYVGGGDTYYGDDNAHAILKYDMDTGNWSRLPRYKYVWFAMTVINHHLTLVGGCDDYGLRVTNQLAVYEPSSQDWTYPYHPMPTPRDSPAVVIYDIWLLVAGGYGAVGRHLATVELLNTSMNQWLAASPLPTPCSYMTSAVLDDYGYIVTESKQVFRVSLPDIVSQTFDQSTANKSPSLWCRLPDTPLEYSSAITLRGYLMALGGSHDNRTRTDIYLYQPENERWTKVGDLPNVRKDCSCVLLPSGELLVAGGWDSYGKRTSRVDVTSILN